MKLLPYRATRIGSLSILLLTAAGCFSDATDTDGMEEPLRPQTQVPVRPAAVDLVTRALLCLPQRMAELWPMGRPHIPQTPDRRLGWIREACRTQRNPLKPQMRALQWSPQTNTMQVRPGTQK